MKTLTGNFVLVLGLGESGLAMARWCAGQGARVRVADSRQAPPGLTTLREACPGIEVVLGAFETKLLSGVDTVAVSPGIDGRAPVLVAARDAGLSVVGEMTLFARALRERDDAARVVAITGTNGKTTTTALAAAMLRAAGVDAVAAGNISPAALAMLMQREQAGQPRPECWVLELSSFQLEYMDALAPDAATVLNVSDDHLDRHGSLDNYARIKARVFAGDGVQVLNRDDARVGAMALPGRRVVTIGSGRPAGDRDFGIAEQDGGEWIVHGSRPVAPLADLPLVGRHNAVNVQAALALGVALGCAPDTMCRALSGFAGLPHRMMLIARRGDGVGFYDDSKGTNVGATVAALEGMAQPVVLIAGGDGKGQDFAPLGEVVARRARAVVLIGRDAPQLEAALRGAGVPVLMAATLDDAVARADALARFGDAVVFSPACASFDMFRNYVHRAEVFGEAVRRLTGKVLS